MILKYAGDEYKAKQQAAPTHGGLTLFLALDRTRLCDDA